MENLVRRENLVRQAIQVTETLFKGDGVVFDKLMAKCYYEMAIALRLNGNEADFVD